MSASFDYEELGGGDYRFRLNKATITVSCDFDDGPSQVRCLLEQCFSGSTYGHTWTLVEGLIRSGADLTTWPEYFDDVSAEYERQLGGAPRYRDLDACPAKERKQIMWKRYETGCRVARKRYVPDDVLMPNFYEGPPIQPSTFRRMAANAGLSIDTGYEYFLRSFDSQQVSKGPNENYSSSAWVEMLAAKWAVEGAAIPLTTAITALSMGEVRTVLKKLDHVAESTKSANVETLQCLARREPQRVEDAVFGAKDWGGTYCVLPPPGLDWDDFQSGRQQIKGMGVLLADLYDGTVRRRSAADFRTLTG